MYDISLTSVRASRYIFEALSFGRSHKNCAHQILKPLKKIIVLPNNLNIINFMVSLKKTLLEIIIHA